MSKIRDLGNDPWEASIDLAAQPRGDVASAAPVPRWPEPRALRVLFRSEGTLPALLLLWAATSFLFLELMTYRNLRPLSAIDVSGALAFGALIPLSLLLGFKARRAARECRMKIRGTRATLPATALSVLAAAVSCMCCLPLLPILLSFLLAGTALSSRVGPWTLAVATWAPWLYLLSAALLLLSVHTSSSSLVAALEAADTSGPLAAPQEAVPSERPRK